MSPHGLKQEKFKKMKSEDIKTFYNYSFIPLWIEIKEKKVFNKEKKEIIEKLLGTIEKLIVTLEILERKNPEINFTPKKVIGCTNMMNEFLKEIIDIFGDEKMSIKYHCALHIPIDCALYGSLGNITTNPFEDLYQVLKSYISGNRGDVQKVWFWSIILQILNFLDF